MYRVDFYKKDTEWVYRLFVKKEDAIRAAEEGLRDGYETRIRGSKYYSTLLINRPMH